MKVQRFCLLTALLAFIVSNGYALSRGGRLGTRVTFTTDDGVIISGLYYPPSGGSRIFILLHGLGSNQEEWQPFANVLVSRGYGFLSYDARGHGESTATKSKGQVSYQEFGAPRPGSPWERMITDLGSAVTYLTSRKGIPANRIGCIGASLGANVCIVYASSHPAVPLIVLLSPGLSYAGITTENAAAQYKNRPIAFVASPSDTYAYQSSILLSQKLPTPSKAAFFAGTKGHGVQMFDGKLERTIVRWIENR